MSAPINTPNAGTGVAGSWHISPSLCVRSDLALGAGGHLGGVGWLDEVTPAMWATLADAMWMQTGTGRVRRPAGAVRGSWATLGHHLVAPLGSRVVVLPLWVAPVVYRPDGSARRCVVVDPPGRGSVVIVSDGGEVVAFIPEVRREVRHG
jgi:hypothetical protein